MKNMFAKLLQLLGNIGLRRIYKKKTTLHLYAIHNDLENHKIIISTFGNSINVELGEAELKEQMNAWL